MNVTKAAAALTNVADALYELSEALTEQPVAAGTSAGVAAGVVSPPGGTPAGLPPVPPIEEVLYADELEEPGPQGSLSICPAHHKPFKDGKFGLYCPGKGIDPAWTNSRGYCTITPKNVDVYLRAHAA